MGGNDRHQPITWGSGPNHGAKTDRVIEYIDFGQRMDLMVYWLKAGTQVGMRTGAVLVKERVLDFMNPSRF
ncbi:MAG: hypothetical protein Ct9H300mP9_2960 [Candidatus Neomarinimicrobiota bacterium]|nr:MAG: hypothetical protein Ct9H300mP9_2960 [Candidatus Neomarinimicrobiota bacterium]